MKGKSLFFGEKFFSVVEELTALNEAYARISIHGHAAGDGI